MLSPLSKEATDEIRYILENIKSGKLKHNQLFYHTDCGTSHCLAGHKQILDYQKFGGLLEHISWISDTKEKDESYQEYFPVLTQTTSVLTEAVFKHSPWDYARYSWGLTMHEARILFYPYTSLDEQFATLKLLEQGKRLESRQDLLDFEATLDK